MVGMGAAHRLLDWALRDHGEFDVFGLLIRRNRLGGSVAEVTRTIADLGERRITLHVLREGVDTATPTGRAIAAIMASLAELGRERRAASRESRRARHLPATKPRSSAQNGKNSCAGLL